MKIERQKYGEHNLSNEEINKLDRRTYYSVSEKAIQDLQKRNNQLIDIKDNPLFLLVAGNETNPSQ